MNTGNICEACDKTGINACGKCLKTLYCSKECQISDWNEHRKYCSLIKTSDIPEQEIIKQVKNDDHFLLALASTDGTRYMVVVDYDLSGKTLYSLQMVSEIMPIESRCYLVRIKIKYTKNLTTDNCINFRI